MSRPSLETTLRESIMKEVLERQGLHHKLMSPTHSPVQYEKPHSPSQTRNHNRIAEQVYRAIVKGHNFITKRCSNPGCGAFLRAAGQHTCIFELEQQKSRREKSRVPSPKSRVPSPKSHGGRRTRRNKRTLRNRR